MTGDDLLLQRTFYGIAATTCSAVFAALWIQFPNYNHLDRVALPIIAVANLGLVTLLYLRRLPVRIVMITAYLLVAGYIVLAYNDQYFSYIPYRGVLSESTYWFGALNMAAYLTFPRRLANALCNGILMLVLVITCYYLATQPHLFGQKVFLGDLLQFLAMIVAINVMQTYFGSFRDRMYAMELAAYQDALTGLANRRAAEEYMQELSAAGRLYTVVLFDLDYFKAINDQYGHATGDQVLTAVGQTIQQQVRGAGLAARWGGEEFMLVLSPRLDSELRQLLEELREHLRHQLFWPNVLGITACFGVAHATLAEPFTAVIHRADTAMYFAKAHGRDGVQFWQEPAASLPSALV